MQGVTSFPTQCLQYALSLPSLLNFNWFPLTKDTVVTTVEIEIFLSQRRSSLPSLLSLKSVFSCIATVAETLFSMTATMVATGAIIWKTGFRSVGPARNLHH